jgi:hypothetical protein
MKKHTKVTIASVVSTAVIAGAGVIGAVNYNPGVANAADPTTGSCWDGTSDNPIAPSTDGTSVTIDMTQFSGCASNADAGTAMLSAYSAVTSSPASASTLNVKIDSGIETTDVVYLIHGLADEQIGDQSISQYGTNNGLGDILDGITTINFTGDDSNLDLPTVVKTLMTGDGRDAGASTMGGYVKLFKNTSGVDMATVHATNSNIGSNVLVTLNGNEVGTLVAYNSNSGTADATYAWKWVPYTAPINSSSDTSASTISAPATGVKF